MLGKTLASLFLLVALNASVAAAPPEFDESIASLAHRWAKISYQTPDAEKAAAFDNAIVAAKQLSQAFPDRAEALVWEAIVLSSAAKVQGGLGALGKVKEARNLLLAAEKINPTVLDGSIYNSLGSLYAKVPGWPIGFGDKGKAREYFAKALAINPDGIDPNYFYAELLIDEGQYAQAAEHLQRSVSAPPRPGREDADAGRRQEASRLLATLKREHGDKLAQPTPASGALASSSKSAGN